jgi:O-antigen/teichoic acid export membrane protein
VTGIFWYFLQQFSYFGVQGATTFILAWFLVPEDFGLMAMVTIFFSLGVTLMDSGISQAIIRKKEVGQIDYSTAFFTNLGLGILAYAILFAAAPAIANFYNEPVLSPLVRIAGLVVVINSFQLIQIADLTRRMDFKVQFRVTLPTSLLSGIVAVALAGLGFGVWSLVAQMLIAALAVTVLYWITNRLRPTWEFSIESFQEMFGFGSKLFLSGLISTAYSNIYIVVIGKIFTALEAGYFYFVQQITALVVTLLCGVVQHVTYPALATLQDDDRTLKESFRNIIKTVVYVLYPGLIALIVLAEPIFRIVLKSEWLPAVPYLQLLCISSLMYPLHAINLNILKVKGRSDLFLYLEIFKTILGLVILLISIPYGVFGILVGLIVSSVLSYVPNSYFSSTLIGYSIPDQVRDVLPLFLVASSMGLLMYVMGWLFSFSDIIEVIVISFAGLVFYLIVNHIIRSEAQSLLLHILEEQLPLRVDNHE